MVPQQLEEPYRLRVARVPWLAIAANMFRCNTAVWESVEVGKLRVNENVGEVRPYLEKPDIRFMHAVCISKAGGGDLSELQTLFGLRVGQLAAGVQANTTTSISFPYVTTWTLGARGDKASGCRRWCRQRRSCVQHLCRRRLVPNLTHGTRVHPRRRNRRFRQRRQFDDSHRRRRPGRFLGNGKWHVNSAGAHSSTGRCTRLWPERQWTSNGNRVAKLASGSKIGANGGKPEISTCGMFCGLQSK